MKFKKYLFKVLVLTPFCYCIVFAQVTVKQNHQVANEKKVVFYNQLAGYYAPTIYQDCKITSGNMQVQDAIVGRDFDGDGDMRSNQSNILNCHPDSLGNQYTLRAEVEYAVRETVTHYYIIYSIYHAIDGKLTSGHSHDTESMIAVVNKNSESSMGRLEFFVTNFHGFARFYASDKDLESQLRTRISKHLSWKDKAIREYLITTNWTDNLSYFHDQGPIHFSTDDKGSASSQGPSIYSCQRSHALYKCNINAWNDRNRKSGYVYSCLPEEGALGDDVECFPMAEEKNISYALINFDKTFLKLIPGDVSELNVDQVALARRQFHMSQADKGYISVKRRELPNGEQLKTLSLPSHYATPKGETPEADLWYNFSGKTPYRLIDPAAFHAFMLGFDPKNPETIDEERVSQHYIYNPFVLLNE